MVAVTPARIVGLGVIALVAVLVGPAPAMAQVDTDRIVVDPGGDGDYRTIGAALDNATDGDTVLIRGGTYTAHLEVNDSVRLRADGSVTLRGDFIGAAITIAPDAAPTISGIDIERYRVGIDARATTTDWSAIGISTRLVKVGVDATRSTGAWQVGGARLTAAATGVTADHSTGNWTVETSVIRADWAITARGSEGAWTVTETSLHCDGGIVARQSTGTWRVSNVTIASGGGVAIDAQATSGDWQISHLEVRWATIALDADHSTGDWTVRNATFGAIAYANDRAALIHAKNTSGAWQITDSAFLDPHGYGIDATNASGGDARGNWWGGPLGASADQCVGTVDCSAPQRLPPGGIDRIWLAAIGGVFAAIVLVIWRVRRWIHSRRLV